MICPNDINKPELQTSRHFPSYHLRLSEGNTNGQIFCSKMKTKQTKTPQALECLSSFFPHWKSLR